MRWGPCSGSRTPIELGTRNPYLRRCIELATEALDAGDEPFGSVLAGADGRALRERRHRRRA